MYWQLIIRRFESWNIQKRTAEKNCLINYTTEKLQVVVNKWFRGFPKYVHKATHSVR
jgi:hypothetical protein